MIPNDRICGTYSCRCCKPEQEKKVIVLFPCDCVNITDGSTKSRSVSSSRSFTSASTRGRKHRTSDRSHRLSSIHHKPMTNIFTAASLVSPASSIPPVHLFTLTASLGRCETRPPRPPRLCYFQTVQNKNPCERWLYSCDGAEGLERITHSDWLTPRPATGSKQLLDFHSHSVFPREAPLPTVPPPLTLFSLFLRLVFLLFSVLLFLSQLYAPFLYLPQSYMSLYYHLLLVFHPTSRSAAVARWWEEIRPWLDT